MKGNVHIGTSGWHYKHWNGPFYPEDMKARDFLPFYAEHFQTVEINNSFYKLPSLETMEAWRDAVPPGFLFAVKANRFITHMKKLTDPEQPLQNLYDRVKGLGEKCGPILFQLPPRWHFNPERLAHFLAALDPGYRYAFEFRHPSWYEPRALELLEGCGAAFCIYDLAGHASPILATAPFVYIRLHGPGGAYQGLYAEEAMQEWAQRIEAWREQGHDVYCYFDNDQAGYAPQNAAQLQQMVAHRTSSDTLCG